MESGSLSFLRRAAPVALLVGAVGSVGLMIRAGHGAPGLLIGLFVLWVLSPFAVLGLATVVAKRRPVPRLLTIYRAMLVLAVGSLAVYGADALRPAKRQFAFAYVIVPPISLLLLAGTGTLLRPRAEARPRQDDKRG